MAKKRSEVEQPEQSGQKQETPAIEMAKRLRLAGVKKQEGEQIIGLLQKLGGRVMVTPVGGMTGKIAVKVQCSGFTFIQDVE